MRQMISSRKALLLTTAVLTLGLAAGATAQQPADTAGAGQKSMGQPTQAGQPASLDRAIATIEKSRDQIQDAQQGQLQRLKQPASTALDELKTKVEGMQGQQAQQVTKSIDSAKQTLNQPQAEKSRIVDAMNKVIEEARSIESAGLSGSVQQIGGASGSGQQSGSSSEQRSAQIDVQQKAPQITVQQPAPQVTVQQPPPQVSVEQPRPQVSVQQPKPDVSVEQAEPQVQVQKQGEAKVNIEKQAQAEVDIQRRGQDSSGGMSSQTDRASEAAASPAGQASGALAMTDRQELIGKDIYGANNENIGEVEDVVMSSSQQIESLLVDVGGFLGIGERRVAIPVGKVRMDGNRLTSDLTEAEARNLPEYQSATQSQ